MGGPLEQAGAVREPSEYAALTMDRGLTGLWTQRSPLRDADVPYIQMKFYSASRFDSLIDGINREVTAKLTWKRRAGSSVYNNNTFPAINSFYSYKRISNGSEVIRVMVDAADGKVYDATAGGKIQIFSKSFGAGKTRFAGVNTSLYFADGLENKKWLQPSSWVAQTSITTTQYAVGTSVIDSNGNLQYLFSEQVGTVTNVKVTANLVVLTFSGTNFRLTPDMGFTVTLGTATFLNGVPLIATLVEPSGGNFIVSAQFVHAPYASTADTGTASTIDTGTPATTGGSAPAWNVSVGGSTTDGLSTWVNYGVPIFNWGPPSAPTQAPTLRPASVPGAPLIEFWRPFAGYTTGELIMSPAGFIQEAISSVGAANVGGKIPQFNTTAGKGVQDGGITWQCCTWFAGGGTGAPWVATTAAGAQTVCVDSNGNLQIVTANGTSGGSQPTWSTAYGATTTDGSITWTNAGPFIAFAFAGRMYGYAYHCIDGSVSTISPLSFSTYGVIGGVQVQGQGSSDPQVDSILIFGTADGQSSPILLDVIANPGASTWTYQDYVAQTLLVAEIPGPQNESNNPPPVGMTAPLYHQGRIWAIYQNTVIRSGGPNVVTGNGNTSFAPLDFTPIPEQPIRITPTFTSQGSATLVWGRANIYIILGDGSSGNPYQPAVVFMARAGIVSYDALTQIGSTFYAFGNTALVGGNIIGKAFSLDPGAGYVEYGFPIGDQFANVTTGTGGKIPNSPPTGYLYNPASTFVTWAELGSGDTALYVADGSVGWFRYSPVASPEAGFLWSPRAVIVGGTSAVQGIETQPGVTQLLIGPASSGPILFRDSSVSGDWSTGASRAFPSYDVKGCIQLCLSGEVGEIAHVHVVSLPQGSRPSVGLLFGEILASTAAPFAWYDRTSTEPPNLAPSQSLYSDRYSMLSKGVTPKCLFFQLGMDYGTQLFPDETLMFSVYGAKYAERKQQ